MKILYLHQYFCTRNGRSGSRSYEFAKYLVKQGHRVTMVTSATELSGISLEPGQRRARFQIAGIDVIAVAIDYSHHMGVFGRVWSFVRFMVVSSWIALNEPRHDVILATSTPLTIGIPGLLASRMHRRPMVFEVRDLWPEAPIQLGALKNPLLIRALRWLESWIYRHSTRIIALSPGIRDGVLATGISSDRVTVIPNCSDLDLFVPEAPDPQVVARYGLQDSFVVTHAGAMGDKNGLEMLVDAAEILQSRGHRDVKVVLVGEGRCDTALRERVRAKGLENVVFTGGMSRLDVAEFLKATDVCLVLVKNTPILSTCSPNKLFDALAAGRPIIVNIDGWMRQLVEENRVGTYATPDSPAALAQAIQDLKGRPELRHEMGARARRLAETHFDRLRLAAQFEAVLSDAAGRPAPPGSGVPTKPVAVTVAVPGRATPDPDATPCEVTGSER